MLLPPRRHAATVERVTPPASGNAVLGIDIYMAANAGIGKQAGAVFRMNRRIGAAMKNDRTRRSIDRIR